MKSFRELEILVSREKFDFRQRFGTFSAEKDQGTVSAILYLTGLGGSRITHSKIWTPPLRFLENWEKNFGVGRPRGPGDKILGVALNGVGGTLEGRLSCKVKSALNR